MKISELMAELKKFDPQSIVRFSVANDDEGFDPAERWFCEDGIHDCFFDGGEVTICLVGQSNLPHEQREELQPGYRPQPPCPPNPTGELPDYGLTVEYNIMAQSLTFCTTVDDLVFRAMRSEDIPRFCKRLGAKLGEGILQRITEGQR